MYERLIERLLDGEMCLDAVDEAIHVLESITGVALAWKNEKPAVAGIFLRVNPGIRHITREHVVEDRGELKVSAHDGSIRMIPVSRLSDKFIWFGPIPEPPRGRDEG